MECLLRGTNWVWKIIFKGLTIYIPVVILRTITVTHPVILRSADRVHLCVLLWTLEQTTPDSYSVDGWVFKTETECVYCTVRIGSINKIYYIFSLKGYFVKLLTWIWQMVGSSVARDKKKFLRGFPQSLQK